MFFSKIKKLYSYININLHEHWRNMFNSLSFNIILGYYIVSPLVLVLFYIMYSDTYDETMLKYEAFKEWGIYILYNIQFKSMPSLFKIVLPSIIVVSTCCFIVLSESSYQLKQPLSNFVFRLFGISVGNNFFILCYSYDMIFFFAPVNLIVTLGGLLTHIVFAGLFGILIYSVIIVCINQYNSQTNEDLYIEDKIFFYSITLLLCGAYLCFFLSALDFFDG
jgi:hypothetical protein